MEIVTISNELLAQIDMLYKLNLIANAEKFF